MIRKPKLIDDKLPDRLRATLTNELLMEVSDKLDRILKLLVLTQSGSTRAIEDFCYEENYGKPEPVVAPEPVIEPVAIEPPKPVIEPAIIEEPKAVEKPKKGRKAKR